MHKMGLIYDELQRSNGKNMWEWQAKIILSILGLAAFTYFFKTMAKTDPGNKFSKSKISNSPVIKFITPVTVASASATGWIIFTIFFSGIWGAYLSNQIWTIFFALMMVFVFLFVDNLRKKEQKKASDAGEEAKISKQENIKLKQIIADLNRHFGKINLDKEEAVIGNDAHKKVLEDALNKCQNRVIILSGWATDRVVNKNFKNMVLNALKRGVTIYIGYGYRARGEEHFSKRERIEARKRLDDLNSWCSSNDPSGRLEIFEFPNHGKLVIKDSDYLVCGSFNWLSNSGFTDNFEISLGITNNQNVDKIADKIVGVFDDLPPTRRRFFKKFLPIKH